MTTPKPAHPAISINTLCLPPAAFARHVEQVVALGGSAISPTVEEITEFGTAESARLLHDAGLAVATLTHRAFGYATQAEAQAARDRLYATLAIAARIAAQTITMTTGGRGQLTWPEAAARFATEISPCAERARQTGVKLALEPTSHLYADASIAHRLSDTVQIVRQAGIDLGIDVFACWFDADIDQAIAAAGPHIALVQVSDYVHGDRGLPCRSVPGDGVARLDRLIPLIHATGFRGYYDLEIFGPRLDAEGAEAGLARGIDWLGAQLPLG